MYKPVYLGLSILELRKTKIWLKSKAVLYGYK